MFIKTTHSSCCVCKARWQHASLKTYRCTVSCLPHCQHISTVAAIQSHFISYLISFPSFITICMMHWENNTDTADVLAEASLINICRWLLTWQVWRAEERPHNAVPLQPEPRFLLRSSVGSRGFQLQQTAVSAGKCTTAQSQTLCDHHSWNI